MLVVGLETLWVLLNIAYCCLSDIEIDAFTEKFLAQERLKALWLRALDFNSEESELVRYQTLHLALTLLGNMLGHKTALAQVQLLNEVPDCFNLLSASLP